MIKTLEDKIVRQGDAGYEQHRESMVWNALKPDRYPDAIVRATTEPDIVDAIRLARESGRQVAVRAGGHSWVGSSLRDDTFLIDLSSLRDVHVDVARRTATVEPAVTSIQLAQTLAQQGLAFPVGHCASVGVGGYLLSGGLGWNSGAWGPACASVFAVDVVTADGELIHATDDDHADVLWAARGGGPGFPGVVTRFHLALQPLPAAITTTTQVYDINDLDELAPWASGVAAGLSTAVEMTVMLTEAGHDLPDDPTRKVAIVTATAFVDTHEEAAALLATLATSPCGDRMLAERELESTPYDVLFRDFGGRWREGCRFASDNVWADADFTETLLPLRNRILEAPSASSFAFAGMSPDPAMDDPEDELPDMAFSMYARTFVACYAMWDDPVDDAANLAWLPSTIAELEQTATGHYIAEADLLAHPSRTTGSYTAASWGRLHEVRRRLDPDQIFVTYLGPATESASTFHSSTPPEVSVP
jgi:FAD/FMN-containing dehydrogenase